MKEAYEIKEIIDSLNSRKVSVIGIDGQKDSGKSTLASELASELGYIHINLDDDEYREKNRGQFVPFVKYDKVREKIENAKNTIILDGVCLLAVCERLSITPGLFIYVKRMTNFGTWRDEGKCDVTGDIEEFIAREKEDDRKFMEEVARIEDRVFDTNKWVFSDLVEEIMRYHHKFKPHKKADIMYKRVV